MQTESTSTKDMLDRMFFNSKRCHLHSAYKMCNSTQNILRPHTQIMFESC